MRSAASSGRRAAPAAGGAVTAVEPPPGTDATEPDAAVSEARTGAQAPPITSNTGSNATQRRVLTARRTSGLARDAVVVAVELRSIPGLATVDGGRAGRPAGRVPPAVAGQPPPRTW